MRRSSGAVLSSAALALALALTGCSVGADAPEHPDRRRRVQARPPAVPAAGTGNRHSHDGGGHPLRGRRLPRGQHRRGTRLTTPTWSPPTRADGSKEWIQADITIDGTTVSGIGVRLKGNSTLRSLSGDGD